jgi:uncharacterized protein
MDQSLPSPAFAYDGRDAGPLLKLLVLQPTPFCNLHCDYCYLPHRSSTRTLSLDGLSQIFRNLFASQLVQGQFTVVWHAGEPLVLPISFYEQALQTISALNIHNYPITHAIQTNGTLLTQGWCDFIKRTNFQIGVSIDGPAFIHDAHRHTRAGKGTHAAVMSGVALLQKNQIDFHVIAVITRHALNFPDEFFRFFMQHGVRKIGLNVEEIEGIHTSSSLGTEGTDHKFRHFMQRLYALAKTTNGTFRIREFEHVHNAILHDAYDFPSEQTHPFAIISVDCEGNFTTFSPEFLGMQSATYGDFILGSVWLDAFESVRATPKFQALYQDIQSGVALCKNQCEYFALCGGGAPANKYYENGTLDSTETMYCRYTTKIPVDIVLQDLEYTLRKTPDGNISV